MSEELQSLLEKINQEGIKKADAEKEKIITAAEAKAEKIIADAKTKADDLMKKSEQAAKRNEDRAADTIRQAARDIILALKDELQGRLKNLARACVGDAMTPPLMEQLILEMEKNFIKSENTDSIEVLLSKKDLDVMEDRLKASLAENLRSEPNISLGHDFTAGLKIGVNGSDLFFDFSDDALSDMICAYVGPRLSAVLNSEKK